MSTQPIVVNSVETLQRALGLLRDGFMRHKYLRVSVKTGKQRSTEQNSHSHTWYEQCSRELPEFNAVQWKQFCKLHFGVPILRGEEEDFRAMYDEKLKHLPYETKFLLMSWIPVTSIMTRAQLKQYEDDMQEYFSKRDVVLTYKKSDEAKAA